MIAFIILHYMATQDTVECIESIKNNVEYTDKRIIVIDNGSPNNSYKELESKYNTDPMVDLIQSKKNLGFACGNNLGFSFAKKHYNPQFIVMINNDTIISQSDFCDIMIQKHAEYHFAVLGPDIVTKDGIHQNPWIREGFTYFGLKEFRIKQRLRILLSYVGIDRRVYKLIHKNDSRQHKVTGDLLDVPLHGAALIFSPEYIENFDGLDDRTFLYFEEEILRLRCKDHGLLMMYSGDVTIYHKEDVATKMSATTAGTKARNEYRNRIRSSRVYEAIKRESDKEKGL